MSQLTAEDLGNFVNDYLKKDLRDLERYIGIYNEEIMEFVQLKNTLQTIKDNKPEGYKTQMNIGGNLFIEAKVDNVDNVLVNVGKDYFLELNHVEAIQFADFKIKNLNKQCDVLRDESIKKRSEIKLALMCIAEKQKLHEQPRED